MKSTKPSFDDIVSAVTDADVARTKPKAPRGRPKSQKTVSAEQKAFVEGYESKSHNRPEPQRLIRALSEPEDRQLTALEDAMNPRQRAFCREYVLDFNQKAAAIRAGYSPKSADAISYNLMEYRGIRRLIELYTASKAQQITTVNPDWIIQKVTEIVTGPSKDGDKLRGLELLARHLGMFIERTEITGKDGEAIKIEETKQKADEVARRLRTMGSKAALSVVK